ncbi:DUF2461 family protein, partial [Yersinia hibernica]|uniref:DUF2461 family protein n=1 Tax=Yersinia hibernica TaxID=2339259 RepID=UPI0028F3FAE9
MADETRNVITSIYYPCYGYPDRHHQITSLDMHSGVPFYQKKVLEALMADQQKLSLNCIKERNIMSEFTGFIQDGLTFLQLISQNNNKEWFEEHRDIYDKHLLQPM